MGCEPGDPKEEPDDEVRSGSPPHVEPDRAHERGHAERPEDHTDGAAEDADQERETSPTSNP